MASFLKRQILINMAASLLVLWIYYLSLNLMNIIGIVVTCSTIINGSILKLNAIRTTQRRHSVGRSRTEPPVSYHHYFD